MCNPLKKLMILMILSISCSVYARNIELTTFEWTKVDETHGKIVAINTTILSYLSGGPCAGSQEWKSNIFKKYKCQFSVGDYANISHSNGEYIKVFDSDRSVASDSPGIVASLNALVGQEFPISKSGLGACVVMHSEHDGVQITGLPSACSGGYIPPIPSVVTCKFSGNVIIDYKNLNSGNVSGAKKTGATTITCNQDTTISLQVYDKSTNSNKVKLRDDKSLSATLTVDGADISSKGENINVKANTPSTINIDSELITSGTPDAGDFTGSAIAVISIP